MQILIEAFGLGLIAGVIPGSILTILLISVIRGGFPAGLRAFLWSLAAELTVVGILLTVLFTLPIPKELFTYIGLIGSFVLFYFAWKIFHLQKMDQPEIVNAVFSGKEIYTLAITNAPLYIFWVTVCTPLIWQLSKTWPLSLSVFSFMITFEIAWSLSTFIVMLLFVKGKQYITDPKSMRRVYLILAVIMFLLGVKMLHTSVVSLLF